MNTTIRLDAAPPGAAGSRLHRLLGACIIIAIGTIGFARVGECQTPIACGQTVTDTTTTSTQTDTYTFTGAAGQVMSVAFYWASAKGGAADIYFAGATAPGATVTAAGSGNATNFTLPSNGTNTIVVHSSADNSTSEYYLTLQSVVGGGCSGYSMSCNQYVDGQINVPSQMDGYELVAGAGEEVTLSVSGFLGVGGVAMDIYDPNGSNTITITSSHPYTFAASGIYTVIVYSSTYARSGVEYNLLMSPIDVDCPTPASVVVTPASQTNAVGTSASFTATATGTGPLAYQWRFDGNFISDATNSTFTIAQAQTNDAGTYSITVNNLGGAVTSAPVVLVVTNSSTNPVIPVTITWNNPAPITYATPLSGVQLDATATAGGAAVSGSFIYTPPSGTILNAGNNQTLTVAFTPDEPSVYGSASGSVSISVLPAALAVTANNAARTYGAPNPAFTGGLTGIQNNDNITASFGCAAISSSPVAAGYPIIPTLVDPGNRLANYTVTTNDGLLTITPAPLTITASNLSKPYGQPFTFECNQFFQSGLQNNETIGCVTLSSPGAAASAPVGVYPILATNATGGTFAIGNYNVAYSTNGTLTVTNTFAASLSINMYAGLQIIGPAGAQYAVQSAPPTTGTPAWTTLTNVTVGSQPFIYIDRTSVTNPFQLYQLVITNAN